ncbi:MAG TPA: TetR/AcrR family transcriptional regulator [Acidimicrobiales bacterium]|jgi:AcrR family transcriptional regulator
MKDESSGTTQWQERTVERSLKAARQRAISRGSMFIAAAVELLRTTGKPDFTVQEVVDHSGMSLRSFYHHFATKDDLLLALVEETVQRHVGSARKQVEAESDPVVKLRVLLTSMFGSEETDDPASRGLVLFQWHLAGSRTDEFAASFSPYVDIVMEILEAGAAAGTFRTDISVPVLASLVIHTLVSILDMRVLGVNLNDEAVTTDDMVRWCLSGVMAGTVETV